MGNSLRFPTCLLLPLIAGALPATARDLTFEERVDAQQAIERVYYSHQLEARLPFDQAVPPEALKAKVRDTLWKSAILQEQWHAPVTAPMLQAEMQRLARSTRLPDRLREVFAALHDDPFLIQECLARPLLVDRLARSFFSSDERIHRPSRLKMEALREALVSGRLPVSQKDERRTLVEMVRVESGDPPSESSRDPDAKDGASTPLRSLRLPEDEYRRWRSRTPLRIGVAGPIEEERDAFVVRVLLEEDDHHARLAEYRTAKVSWDSWREMARTSLDEY
ncbi:MAG TPA: hypothetical protein VFW45_09305, partial [Candidatus Polarisedimenticolia bacterium]|nr:hypothetical protein [Candidatus Polarisedimenticolia bacterium]